MSSRRITSGDAPHGSLTSGRTSTWQNQHPIRKSIWINPTQWIAADVAERTRSGFEPNRITLHIPPRLGVVIPEVVVVDVRDAIPVLPRIAQRELVGRAIAVR